MKSKAEKLHELLGEQPLTPMIPTIEKCKQILDELDKPALDYRHRKHLQLLVDGEVCFVKVDDSWQKAETGESTFNGLVGEMIDLGLLEDAEALVTKSAGMTAYVYVTDAGIEALKQ